MARLIFFSLLSLALAGPTAPAKKCLAGPPLKHWPPDAAKTLNRMIAANANSGRYAVFDMDNTSYRYDVEESLIPFLENKGVISRDSIDPSLKIIPFKDTPTYTESLYSYYNRLCDFDDILCYPFSAEIFSGIPLRQLKVYVDELMALNTSIPTTVYEGDVPTNTTVNPPRIFRGQVELFNRLQANGIDVYIMSASAEELARMVVTDPKYGYNLKPEHVIGVSLVLKNQTSGALTSVRSQIAEGTYNMAANMDLVLTPTLWTPNTWQTGKWAAVLSYISNWKKPILVAGDTPLSDGPMLFHGVDVARGGIHLWVNRKDKYMTQMNGMMKQYAEEQKEEGLPVTADKNWIIVKPEDIL
ncbi:phosphorylcholine phosphatase [Purpureocillium lavendulum]|uniref:Phosphorylcholine phosphatase n=1 Tax=Purpureocillium lavendulum TaxID=1247861 RepID=A0AB34FGW7_9HYPO|nr:phosphorylcholine phosphatase [Purpureocillium lavendulum]